MEMLTEKQLSDIKQMAQKQECLLLKDSNSDNLVSFDYKGICIVNPFKDETGRFDVNPIEYYGKCFLESAFLKR